MMRRVLSSLILVALVGCGTPGEQSQPDAQTAAGTCREIFPSYWQDPNPKFVSMWEGQTTSDTPPIGWDGPVFRLSDAYPTSPVDESGAQPWRASRFDALFDPSTDEPTKSLPKSTPGRS